MDAIPMMLSTVFMLFSLGYLYIRQKDTKIT